MRAHGRRSETVPSGQAVTTSTPVVEQHPASYVPWASRAHARQAQPVQTPPVTTSAVVPQPRRAWPRPPKCVGGVASSVLANVVCTGWIENGRSGTPSRVPVRYADDECICCPSRERAEAALAVLGEILAGLGLSVAADKTRIVHMADGTSGDDFLGFTLGWCPRVAPGVPLPGVLAE